MLPNALGQIRLANMMIRQISLIVPIGIGGPVIGLVATSPLLLPPPTLQPPPQPQFLPPIPQLPPIPLLLLPPELRGFANPVWEITNATRLINVMIVLLTGQETQSAQFLLVQNV